MSVMHLNELSSTLTLGSDALSTACAAATSRHIVAGNTNKADTTGREKLIMAPLHGDWSEHCAAPIRYIVRDEREFASIEQIYYSLSSTVCRRPKADDLLTRATLQDAALPCNAPDPWAVDRDPARLPHWTCTSSGP